MATSELLHLLAQEAATTELSVTRLRLQYARQTCRPCVTMLHASCRKWQLTLSIMAYMSGARHHDTAATVRPLAPLLLHVTELQLETGSRQLVSLVARMVLHNTVKLDKLVCNKYDALLGRAVTKIRTVRIKCDLSGKEVKAIFENIVGCEDMKLENLSLSSPGWAEVEADILARGVCKLVRMDFHGRLTYRQAAALFASIAGRDVTLVKLGIEQGDMGNVEPTIMARAICKLSEAKVPICKVSQLHVLLETIAIAALENELHLQKLILNHKIFVDIRIEHYFDNADLVAEAFSKLREVTLTTEQDYVQVSRLLEKVAYEDTVLTSLVVANGCIESVPNNVLVDAACKLRRFCNYKLSGHTANTLFTAIATREVKLEKLRICCEQFGQVEAASLAQVDIVDIAFTVVVKHLLLQFDIYV